MEKITSHIVDGIHNVGIRCLDEKDANFCHHRYGIDLSNDDRWSCIDVLIQFQKGPVKAVGPNGITIESLLAICAHRLGVLQQGPLNCNENDVALKSIERALELLKNRTMRRLQQKIEGELVEAPKEETKKDE